MRSTVVFAILAIVLISLVAAHPTGSHHDHKDGVRCKFNHSKPAHPFHRRPLHGRTPSNHTNCSCPRLNHSKLNITKPNVSVINFVKNSTMQLNFTENRQLGFFSNLTNKVRNYTSPFIRRALNQTTNITKKLSTSINSFFNRSSVFQGALNKTNSFFNKFNMSSRVNTTKLTNMFNRTHKYVRCNKTRNGIKRFHNISQRLGNFTKCAANRTKGFFNKARKLGITDFFSSATGIVNQVASTWTNVVNAFKTSKSSTIKDTLQGKGFSYFTQKATFKITNGLRAQYLDQYLDRTAETVQVPADKTKELKNILQEVSWSDSSIWNLFNVVFDKDKGGNNKYVSFLAKRDEATDKYFFILANIDSTFSLAPDVLIINKQSSIAGGIFSSNKDVRKNVPRSITQEDVQAVINFFFVCAFKTFADALGIKVTVPNM